MIDLEQLKILMQLEDNLETAVNTLEKAYNSKDAEAFHRAKIEILSIQNKISEIINQKIV